MDISVSADDTFARYAEITDRALNSALSFAAPLRSLVTTLRPSLEYGVHVRLSELVELLRSATGLSDNPIDVDLADALADAAPLLAGLRNAARYDSVAAYADGVIGAISRYLTA